MAGNAVNIVVTARNATQAGFRAVRNASRNLGRAIVRDMRQAGRDASSAIGQGLRGGIGNAFASAMHNPYLATVITAVGVTLGTLLGAAIAGALVLGWGALFVGMGIAFTLQNKKIRKTWKETLSGIAKDYTALSKPMEHVIETARKNLKSLADSFAPHFGRALKQVQPSVSAFIDYFSKGIKDMGKKSFAPMMLAFQELLDAFGPELQEWLGELGTAFGVLAGVVIRNKAEIAQALHAVLSIITIMVYTVAILAEGWGTSMRLMAAAVNGVQNAFQSFSEGCAAAGATIISVVKSIVSGLLTGVAAVLRGMAKFNDALGIGDMGDKLRSAARGIESFRDSANRSFDSAKGAVDRFNARVKVAGKIRHLKMDISDWKGKLNTAQAKLKHTMSRPARKKIQADIAQLKRKIAEAQAKIRGLRGKTVHVRFAAIYDKGLSPRMLAAAHGRASGGNIGMATGGMASGGNRKTLVGEHGPELVDLPTGAHVNSNPDTKRKLGQMGGGGGVATIEIKSSGNRIDDLLIEILRNAVRSRGGNVQLVIGGRKVA